MDTMDGRLMGATGYTVQAPRTCTEANTEPLGWAVSLKLMNTKNRWEKRKRRHDEN